MVSVDVNETSVADHDRVSHVVPPIEAKCSLFTVVPNDSLNNQKMSVPY